METWEEEGRKTRGQEEMKKGIQESRNPGRQEDRKSGRREDTKKGIKKGKNENNSCNMVMCPQNIPTFYRTLWLNMESSCNRKKQDSFLLLFLFLKVYNTK